MTINRVKLQRSYARAIVVITILNLNGVFYMLAGISRVFSPILLLLTLLLMFSQKVRMPSLLMITFVASTIFYLAFGSIFLAAFFPPEGSVLSIFGVVGMLLIVFSVGGYLASETDRAEVEDFFRFVRNVSVISAGMTWASSWLNSIYVYVPPSSTFRSAGLFGNPNQAGLMGSIAFSLCLVFPFRNKFVQTGALILAIGGTILSFSKAAIVLLVVIAVIWLVRSSKWLLAFLVPLPVVVLIALASGPNPFLDIVASQEVIHLKPRQQDRLNQILLILSTGELNSETTTNRSIMWEISIERALEKFPFGYGLGTFQRLRDGLMEGGEWQGAHNLFLMIWGEAGFLSLVVFLAFFSILGWRSLIAPKIGIEQYFFLILLISALTSHDSFNQRFINILIAILIGSLHSKKSRGAGLPSGSLRE